MSVTHSQDNLHSLCKGWENLIKLAEEEIPKTASKRRIKQLRKLVRVSKQVLDEKWFPLSQGSTHK
jgi:hypothetical protein